MFEKEIKFIYDYSVNQIKQLGSYFSYEELNSVDLHPAILKYISAELDYLIYEDRERLLRNSNFDYSGNNIGKYFDLIALEIKKSKKFSFEYINNLTLHAISFTINFLAQPRWTLSKLIFEKDEEVSTAELRQILNYVYFYDYLTVVADKYLVRKKLLSFSKHDFEALLEKVDQEVFRNDPEKMIDLVQHSIGEFLNLGNIQKSKIPLLVFELFLKEKKLDQYLDRLAESFGDDVKQVYSITELHNLIFSPIPVKKGNYLERILKQENPAALFGGMKPKKADEEEAIKAKDNSIPVIKDIPENEIVPDDRPENKTQENIEAVISAEPAETLENHLSEDKNGTGSELSAAETETGPELSSEETEIVEEFLAEERAPVIFETEEESVIPEDVEYDDKNDIIKSGTENEINFAGADSEDLEAAAGQYNTEEEETKDFIDQIPADKAPDKLTEQSGSRQSSHSGSKFILKIAHGVKEKEHENSGQQPEIKAVREPEEQDLYIPADEKTVEASEGEVFNKVTFSRINAIVSEFFSKRELKRIISDVFNDDTEYFAKTFFNIISEAKDGTEAVRKLDSLFESNRIDPASRGAKIMKKNILKYFNQM
ncbi:MAG: hypothetical protein ACM3S2_13480 [Ignavibacteriales bacterium]